MGIDEKLWYCTKCKRKLPAESFNKSSKLSNGGLSYQCKECVKANQKEYNKKTMTDKHREKQQRYDDNLKKHFGMSTITYRKWQKELPTAINKEQWEFAKKYFSFKCAYCGEERPLAKEHFISLYENGEFSINNIVPACRSCNTSKGNRNFFEWYPNFHHYSAKRHQKIPEFLNYKGDKQQLKLNICI